MNGSGSTILENGVPHEDTGGETRKNAAIVTAQSSLLGKSIFRDTSNLNTDNVECTDLGSPGIVVGIASPYKELKKMQKDDVNRTKDTEVADLDVAAEGGRLVDNAYRLTIHSEETYFHIRADSQSKIPHNAAVEMDKPWEQTIEINNSLADHHTEGFKRDQQDESRLLDSTRFNAGVDVVDMAEPFALASEEPRKDATLSIRPFPNLSVECLPDIVAEGGDSSALDSRFESKEKPLVADLAEYVKEIKALGELTEALQNSLRQQQEIIKMKDEDHRSQFLERRVKLKEAYENELKQQKAVLFAKLEKTLQHNNEKFNAIIEEREQAFNELQRTSTMKLHTGEENLQILRGHHERLNEELKEKTLKMQKLDSAYRIYKASFRTENKKLMEKIEALEEEVHAKDLKIDGLRKEHELYIMKMDASIASAVSQHQAFNSKDTQITELMANIDRLSSLSNRLEEENAELAAKLQSQEKKVSEERSLNEELKKTIAKQNEFAENKDSQFHHLMKDQMETIKLENEHKYQQRLTSLREELQSEMNVYILELNDCKMKLVERDSKIFELQKLCTVLNQEVPITSKSFENESEPKASGALSEWFSSDTAVLEQLSLIPDSLFCIEKPLPTFQCISCVSAREDLLQLRKLLRESEKLLREQQRDMQKVMEQNTAIKSELRVADQKLKLGGKSVEQTLYLRNLILSCFRRIPLQMDELLEDLISVVYKVLNVECEEIQAIMNERPNKPSSSYAWALF